MAPAKLGGILPSPEWTPIQYGRCVCTISRSSIFVCTSRVLALHVCDTRFYGSAAFDIFLHKYDTDYSVGTRPPTGSFVGDPWFPLLHALHQDLSSQHQGSGVRVCHIDVCRRFYVLLHALGGVFITAF
jgi:hypothetical protein